MCNASDADVSDQADETNDTARCYNELAVDFTPCERRALRAHEADALALLQCLERDRAQLVACCARDGACSYDRIDPCTQELWPDASSGPCTADIASIDRAVDACEQGLPPVRPRDPCARSEHVTLGWDEPSEIGQTPAQTFEAFDGSCSAEYVWTGAFWPGLSATPTTASGTLHIEVALERAGAAFLRPLADTCDSNELAIPARVRVETSDGLLQEQFETVVRRSAGDFPLRIKLLAEQIEGRLDLRSSQPGKLWLNLNVRSMGARCEGSMNVEFEGDADSSGAREGVGGGTSGSWSSN